MKGWNGKRVVGVALWIAAAAWVGGCGGNDRDGGAKAAKPPVAASRPRQGGLDVTFLVTADTHFGGSAVTERGTVKLTVLLEEQIEQMNDMPGRQWPAEIGGTVGVPRGVLVAGDLTDDGQKDQWSLFEAAFGLTGRDGRVKFPVYEGIGNHDTFAGTYVAEQVARRHGRKYYSWDWDDLHVVSVGEGANDEELAWLREDLAKAGRQVPVVLYLHYSLSGPYSDSNWFGQGDYHERFRKTIEGYNVVAIFHGHYHASRRYRWHGIDVYNVGSARHSARCFAVVHVTDDRLTVGSWYWHGRGYWLWHHNKPIGAGAGATVPKEQAMMNADERR
jgi:cytolysin (calcineurin-like family phosphatase)